MEFGRDLFGRAKAGVELILQSTSAEDESEEARVLLLVVNGLLELMSDLRELERKVEAAGNQGPRAV